MKNDWQKIKENTIVVKFKNMKTKEVITGFKDNAVPSRRWYPCHENGDYISTLRSGKDKAEIIAQLEEYMKNH